MINNNYYAIFFISGWGMPVDFFSPLVNRFVEVSNIKLDCYIVDFGYYGDNNVKFIKKRVFDARLKNKKIVVITHSFGISGLVDLFADGCDYLFSICGFSYFRQDWRDYDFLLKLFNKDIKRCLKYFHELCDIDTSSNGWVTDNFRKVILEERLLAIRDFLFLDKIDIKTKVALLSRNDRVVPYDLSFGQFSELGYIVFTNDDKGHSLGYDGSSWCYGVIDSVLKGYEV